MRPFVILLLVFLVANAQERVKSMPGYERYMEMRGQIRGSIHLAALTPTWIDEGKALQFDFMGKRYRYDVEQRKRTEIGAAVEEASIEDDFVPSFGPAQARGRQAESANSPNGQWTARYRDRNLFLSKRQGDETIQVTHDGSAEKRIKNGSASWVYGEELFQRTAIWWSPDSKKVAFYRFDESKVEDYFLTLGLTERQSRLDIEPFPKPGTANPVADILIYDLETKSTITVDIRDGKPFADDVVGHYAYAPRWRDSGSELLIQRMNRLQNVWELVAADANTGKARVVVREENPGGWVDTTPTIRWLDDQRFIFSTRRNGWRNFDLYDLDKGRLNSITSNNFNADQIIRIEEKSGWLYYMARSGDNPYYLQLHRATLDGKADRRLTDPKFNHRVHIAPDQSCFVDIAQTHRDPPEARLVGFDGKLIDVLAVSETTLFERRLLQRAVRFEYMAADGKTKLYGYASRPSNFDPNRKYPVVIGVYGGPESRDVNEDFAFPDALTEFGFIYVRLDTRASNARGLDALNQLYRNLGVAEIDDMAEGVKALVKLPYVDSRKIGIYGTSYGGYAAIMCLLRHPDLFTAACGSSPTTDWKMYDTIYTERYMGLPDDNQNGYLQGNAIQHAKNLKGRLMIYYGTADNNVHPCHSLGLIAALMRENKSFDVQVGPDRGHTGLNQMRMMEFFIEAFNDPFSGAKTGVQ